MHQVRSDIIPLFSLILVVSSALFCSSMWLTTSPVQLPPDSQACGQAWTGWSRAEHLQREHRVLTKTCWGSWTVVHGNSHTSTTLKSQNSYNAIGSRCSVSIRQCDAAHHCHNPLYGINVSFIDVNKLILVYYRQCWKMSNFESWGEYIIIHNCGKIVKLIY